jgi:hypothetical protein
VALKNPLLMYYTIRFGTASKAAPQGRHLYRAGVGVELAISIAAARVQSFLTPQKKTTGHAARLSVPDLIIIFKNLFILFYFKSLNALLEHRTQPRVISRVLHYNYGFQVSDWFSE